MILLRFAPFSFLVVTVLSFSAYADSQTGGLVELWEQHDALSAEVAELTDNFKTNEEVALRSHVPIFNSLRRDYLELITDPVLYSQSPLRQGEVVEISPEAIFAILKDAVEVWDSLQSNEIIMYLSLADDWQQASSDFKYALAEIEASVVVGVPSDIWSDMAKLDALSQQGDVLATLFVVFRDSIETNSDTKTYLLERLEQINQISEGISDYLETLSQLNDLFRERLVAQWIEDPDP
jgi:hypothetical protein